MSKEMECWGRQVGDRYTLIKTLENILSRGCMRMKLYYTCLHVLLTFHS